MPKEDTQILHQKPESLVRNATWRHYMFYVIHAFQSIATAISSPVLSQYLYSRLNQQYFAEQNITYVKNDTTSCKSLGHCYINKTTEEYHLQQRVQAITAGWTKTFSYASGIPEIFAVLIIGSWMDILGRKVVVSLNMIGHIVRYVTYALLMKSNLPTEFLVLGYIVEGCTGGYRLNMLISFAYTADITPKNYKRALLIVVSEHIFAACAGFASVGAGYFICHAGFFWPLILAIAILSLMFVLFIAIVPETVTTRKLYGLSPKMTAKRLVKFYICSKQNSESVHKFWLCLLAFATLSLSVIGEFSLETLFVLNSPFCWDSVKIANFTATMSFLSPIFTLLVFKLMQRCMTEELIGSTTFLFFITRCFMKAFATNDAMIYISGLIGSPGLLSFAMIRTIVSHLTDPSEQGSVFAGLGTVEALCGMTSSVMLNTIYAHTLLWMKGFVFIVVAISCVVPASLLLGLHFVNKKEKSKTNVELSLDTNTTDSIASQEPEPTLNPAVNAAFEPIDKTF